MATKKMKKPTKITAYIIQELREGRLVINSAEVGRRLIRTHKHYREYKPTNRMTLRVTYAMKLNCTIKRRTVPA